MQKLRRQPIAKLIFPLLLTLAFAQFINAQNDNASSDPAPAVEDRKNEFGVWGGFAPNTKKLIGSSRDSNLGLVALRYSRRIASSDSLALKYVVDVIPALFLNYERQPLVQVPGTPNTFRVESRDTTAYAAGFSPVGLQLNFRRKKKFQPFVSLNLGMLFFNKRIPDDTSPAFPNRHGTRFNFHTDGGFGLQYVSRTGRSYTFGYKFHHISNASRGNINPGFDSNLFYFGFSVFK